MSDQPWFYEAGGSQQGPVSEAAIRGMVSSGVLQKGSLVWREGLPDWTPLENTELCENGRFPPVVPGNPRAFTPRAAGLNPNFNFGIFEALGAGWKLMVSDFWPFVGFYTLVVVILGVASNLLIPIFFLTFPMMGGFMYYTLKRLRGEPGDVENVFDGFKRRFGSLALLSFLVFIPVILGAIPLIGFFVFAVESRWMEENVALAAGLVGGGTLLLIVVASIFGTIASLATLLCLDCDIEWSRALKLAFKVFEKQFIKMTVFSVLASLLVNAGVLFCYVGCLVSGPWIVAAMSFVYERAFGDSAHP